MLTKKILILFAYIFVGHCEASAQTDTYSNNLSKLYALSLNNINLSSTHVSDSIISLCQVLEYQARVKKDNVNLFKIGQIYVNASCQRGDMATAITKTKQMYEEAGRTSSKEGLVLSLQAFGDNYVHSRQYSEAFSTFAEAEKEAEGLNDDMLHIRLIFQQLHTSLAMHLSAESQSYIDRLESFPQLESDTLLMAHMLYYKASLSLLRRNPSAALEYFNQIETFSGGYPSELSFLHQMIMSRYYNINGDYDKASSILDTLLLSSSMSGNDLEHRDMLLLKARILTKSENYSEACDLYEQVRVLSESININRYVSSVDTLRAAYYTDRLQLENISSRNRFTVQSVILISLLLAASILLFLMLRRKNKQLRQSRIELLRITEASTQSIQTKSLFLSNMSHDLRTPLNAIAGFSCLLADTEEVDEETKKMCGEYIQQNSQLLLKLFDDILDLSALNENKMHFTIESCNVTTLCRNVTDTVKSLKNTDNELLFESHVDNLILNTDNIRLQQVLINLLVNATKFTQGGVIRLVLDVDSDRQEAMFTVEDTGCGIPLEKQSGIFERFEKLNEKKQGAGLGLSICKLIVDHLGGRIWIDSTYTQGARFIFTHPLNL